MSGPLGEGETGTLQLGWSPHARVQLPYMDEVFVSATDDVVVGDCDGVDAAPAGL